MLGERGDSKKKVHFFISISQQSLALMLAAFLFRSSGMSDESEKRFGKTRISPDSSSPLSSSREHSPKGIFQTKRNQKENNM